MSIYDSLDSIAGYSDRTLSTPRRTSINCANYFTTRLTSTVPVTRSYLTAPVIHNYLSTPMHDLHQLRDLLCTLPVNTGTKYKDVCRTPIPHSQTRGEFPPKLNKPCLVRQPRYFNDLSLPNSQSRDLSPVLRDLHQICDLSHRYYIISDLSPVLDALT